MSFLCSGRASKCDMWQCDGADNSNICSFRGQNRRGEVLSLGFYTLEPTSGPGHLSTLWWHCQPRKGTKI